MDQLREPEGFNEAAKLYIALRNEVDGIDRDVKARKAELRERMTHLENWFALRAQEEGLTTIATNVGTAYWSTHNTATVADRGAFFEHCKSTDNFDLIESRASKTAVKSYIDAYGAPPPGVNFGSTRVFNLRQNHKDQA